MRDFLRDPILETVNLHAPLARVFALSTRVELVRETLGMTLMDDAAPGSVSAGHITAHSRVHWRGWKFGLPTHHHTLITGFEEPHATSVDAQAAWFQDSQERGRFAFFQHDHFFTESLDPTTGGPVTTLRDEVRFALPFGPLGRFAASWMLAPHIAGLCRLRFARIRALAEGDGWRKWIA